MPSYRLALDAHGDPTLVEELSGQHPDELLFARLSAGTPERGWVEVAGGVAAVDNARTGADRWQIILGADGSEQSVDSAGGRCSTTPFRFE